MKLDELIRRIGSSEKLASYDFHFVDIKPDDLTGITEFGVDHLFNWRLSPERVQNRFEEVRNWMRFASERKSLNSVYLDTTTLYTIEELVVNKNSLYLTPATLLDLATFVNSVVLYDNIFHLENNHIDSTLLNELIGVEPIVIELPVSSFEGEYYGDHVHSLGSLLRGIWEGTETYMHLLFPRFEPDSRSPYFEEAQEFKKAWQTLFDFTIDHEQFSLSHQQIENDRWDSDGPGLLTQLASTGGFAMQRGMNFLDQRPAQASKETYDLISECDYRSLFNMNVSNLLQIQYIPNTYRMPFRRYLYERAKKVESELSSLKIIEKEYRKNIYFGPDQNNLTLPFFLSGILAQISSLSEFFQVLAETRHKARAFRKRRQDLDHALHEGNSKEAENLQDALQKESKNLLSLFPHVPIAAAIGAVLSTLSGNPTPMMLTTIGILAFAAQYPPEQIEKLKKRVLTPQFWFLTDLKNVSLELTNLYPKVCRLWGVPENGQLLFVKQFELLAELGH